MLKARPELEETALVILSGRDGLLDRIKGRLVGAHAYLTKPFHTQTIVEVVQMHVERVNGREITKPLSPSRLAVTVLGQEVDQRAKRGTRP